MKCPVVTKCCFGVPLRKGVLIFGYINLIISLLGLTILIFLAVEGMTTEDLFKKLHVKGGKVLNLNLNITLTALEGVMASILLFGVHKKKKNILKVYFYTGLVLCTLPLFIDVIFFNAALKTYFSHFIAMGLSYYLLFLVYQLIHTAEEPAAGMQFTNHTPNTNL